MEMPFKTGFQVVSPFGYRTDPITGQAGSWHGGVDLVGNDRSVRAVADGYVLRSRKVEDTGNGDRTWEWGNYVSVMGDDGRICFYCHLESRNVESYDRVTAGTVIGIEGSTGRSTGIHLHFEVRDPAGKQLDPCAYLKIPNRAGYEWDPPEPWEAEAHDWSREAVEWAVSREILKGKGGDNYALGDFVTREELCVIMHRAREVL